MPNPHNARRTAGTLLLAGGLTILLGVAGYLGWTQIQAAGLRAQLRQTPASPIAALAASPTVLPVTSPTLTLVLPTPTLAALAPTVAPSPAAAATATSAPAAAAAPTAEVTATRIPPTLAPPAPAATIAAVAAAPVRMAIPDLKIDTRVVPMGWDVVQTADGPRSDWVIPKNEAGHHINSALLGQPGNLVISGHNNIYGQVFKPLSFAWDNDQRIRVDEFTDRSEILNGRQIQLFDAAGNAYTYVVTDFYRLKDTGVSLQQRLANGRFMQPTEDTRLTVITCWPPTNNTHRLVVIAAPAK